MPNFFLVEPFLGKILKLKLGMKNLFRNLLDLILSRNSTDQNGPLCRGIVLLTDFCSAC